VPPLCSSDVADDALYTITAPKPSRHSVAVIRIRCSSGCPAAALARVDRLRFGGSCEERARRAAGDGIPR